MAQNGLFVANREGADPHAVLLFAILHDCRHENDGHDPEHGPRAAARAESIGHEPLGLTPGMLATLARAMRHHGRGQVSDHPLVGTCWDADRLDLPRVGITPDPRLMSTVSGQHAEVIATLADHRRDAPSWGDLAGSLSLQLRRLRRCAASGVPYAAAALPSARDTDSIPTSHSHPS